MNKQLLLNAVLLLSIAVTPFCVAGEESERMSELFGSPSEAPDVTTLSNAVTDTATAYLAARSRGESDGIQKELLAAYSAAKRALAEVSPSENEDESGSDENESDGESECNATQKPIEAIAPQKTNDEHSSSSEEDSDSSELESDSFDTSSDDFSDAEEDALPEQEKQDASNANNDNNNTKVSGNPTIKPTLVVKARNLRTIGIVVVGGVVYYRFIAPRLAKRVSKMKEGRMKNILSTLTFARKAA